MQLNLKLLQYTIKIFNINVLPISGLTYVPTDIYVVTNYFIEVHVAMYVIS